METFVVAQIFDINDVAELSGDSDTDYVRIEVFPILQLEELAELKERFDFGISYLFGNFDDAKFALAAIKINATYWCIDEDGKIAAFGATKSKALESLATWFNYLEKQRKKL
jgi:hypothetical protein